MASLSASELQVVLLILRSEQCDGLAFVADALRLLEERVMAHKNELGAEDLGRFCYSSPIQQSRDNFRSFTCTFGHQLFSEKAAEV